MNVVGITSLKRAFDKLLCGYFGTGLVFVLSPVLLLLAGFSPEGGTDTNVELGFSLLSLAGASGCAAGLISNAYRLLAVSLPVYSPFVRLPAQPEGTSGERPDEREWALPVVTPSLVLPTLISGLGGWVDAGALAPRVEAPPSAA